MRNPFIAMAVFAATAVAGAAPARIDVNPGDSLVAVRDKVRMLPAAKKADGVEVVLADGEYVLTNGLLFIHFDLGKTNAPIVWKAASPGAVRIVGAPRIPVSLFSLVDDPAVVARLPAEAKGKVYAADVSAFCPKKITEFGNVFYGAPPPPAVFIDGTLAPVASYPNDGEWATFSKRVDKGDPIPKGNGTTLWKDGAFVWSDPRARRWDFSRGVWLNGYFTHDWDNVTVKAGSYGTENGTNDVMRLDGTINYGVLGGTWGRKERRFRAVNLLEELDAPGEWWLDRENKVLYVVPPGGKMADSTDIRLAFSEKPLMNARAAADMRFEGIEFAFNYGSLVDFYQCNGISFVGCCFLCTARGGISLNGNRNRVSGCDVSFCGSGGVGVSGGDRATLTRCDSIVENCRIHDFGILKRTYAGGLHIGGCGVTARGNEIWNAPHTAVFFPGNEHLLESNDVHHVLLETGDAGAFYTGRDWTTQGNVLRYNYVHDIGTGTTTKEGEDAAVSGTNVMGFYFDDCDCGDEIYGNVFRNVGRGILIGGGRDHPVRSNLFVNCRLGISIDCRGWRWKARWNVPGEGWELEAKAQKFDYTNGLWAARYPRLANIMNDYPREPLYNPVEDNTFIDCGNTLNINEILKFDRDGTAPGIMSRMAPIRGNTVIYTEKSRANLSKLPWVGDGRPNPANAAAFYDERPAPEFRAHFFCPIGMTNTVLRIAAAGYYTLCVNGVPPDESAGLSLMPLWSPVDKTIYSDEYQISSAVLKPWPETNEVTVVIGNGFRNLPPLRFWGSRVFRDVLSSGSPVFKLAMDGVKLSQWKWRETEILRNCVYLGTEIDATRGPGAWRPTAAADGPKGRIVPRRAPPISVYGTLRGRASWLRKGEVQVVDFGENGTGVPSFRIHGRRGQRVEFLYGERLNADGSVNVLTQTAGQVKRPGMGGPGAPDVAAQRDAYVCSGAEGGETFTPPFTWHVCRYVEVRGLDRLLGDGDAELRLVSSSVADAAPGAGFSSGDADIYRLHKVCRRTFRDNLMGVQSDCPGRERLGYGGDIVATCEAFMLNYDMREFYLKTLQDFADEAEDDGWITETAPYVGIASQGFGGRAGPVSWSLAVPVLMDGLLRHYGETRALDFYPVCARYVRLVSAKCPDGLVPKCISDHEALERAPDGVTATAHWHRFVELTAGFARRLGRADEAQEFEALAKKIKAAFAAKYVSNGVVANGTQSAQAIGLYLGLVPEEQRETAFAKLVSAVEEKECAPTTGIFSTRYMLLCLSENGRIDLAKKIVLHRGFPGWMHMLENGATTLWETWKESDDVYSNCHPMFGSVDEWILRYIPNSSR